MAIAILLAGGKGNRIKSSPMPKQFIEVNKTPIAAYTISTFNKHPLIERIFIVSALDDISKMKEIVERYHFQKVATIIAGGITRKQSATNALDYLKQHNIKENEIILIHDMARGLVDEDIITRNIEATKSKGSAVTAVPLKSTIVVSKNHQEIEEVTNREDYYEIQTPQTFLFKDIYKAHKNNKDDTNVTDDSRLVFNEGIKIYLVEGNYNNFKVTTDEDIDLLKLLVDKCNIKVK